MPSIRKQKQTLGEPSVASTQASSSNGTTRSKKRKARGQKMGKGKQSFDGSQEQKKGKGKQLFDGSQESSNSNQQRKTNMNTQVSGKWQYKYRQMSMDVNDSRSLHEKESSCLMEVKKARIRIDNAGQI